MRLLVVALVHALLAVDGWFLNAALALHGATRRLAVRVHDRRKARAATELLTLLDRIAPEPPRAS